jgi:hypothetical protein
MDRLPTFIVGLVCAAAASAAILAGRNSRSLSSSDRLKVSPPPPRVSVEIGNFYLHKKLTVEHSAASAELFAMIPITHRPILACLRSMNKACLSRCWPRSRHERLEAFTRLLARHSMFRLARHHAGTGACLASS